ncbi:MAG: response regulator [Blastomonas sp.]
MAMFRKAPRALKNILIVEDEPLVAFENELRLAEVGYQVVATVDNEREAIAALESRDVQLVLADVQLANGGDGVEVARIARAKGVAVLFVTGNCPDMARQYALGCLIKPYTARDLVNAVHAIGEVLAGRKPKSTPRPLIWYEDEGAD